MSELKQLEMQKDDEMEIDLGEIFHLLMNKLWIIVLCSDGYAAYSRL